jgi:hypothetical protein
MKRETAPRFAGIGGHHSHKAGTVEWLTPPEIIAALGPFDLDPCTPAEQPWPTAARRFTRADNGLTRPWAGRVWLCPPYTNAEIARWLARMADHDNGTALIFARTETEAFFEHVWNRATALLFMHGRINFHHGPGHFDENGGSIKVGSRAKGNAGAPTVLCAYGADDADVLAACRIDGRFVPLRIPRSVIVSLFAASNEEAKSVETWSAVLAEFFADRRGPVALDDLYRHFAGHRKASMNRNFDAKLRQQLQRGPYRRVDRGLWEKRA